MIITCNLLPDLDNPDSLLMTSKRKFGTVKTGLSLRSARTFIFYVFLIFAFLLLNIHVTRHSFDRFNKMISLNIHI